MLLRVWSGSHEAVAHSDRGTAVHAGLGLVLWGVVAIAVVSDDPGGGADIGAGLLALLALALSILAAGSLVTSARTVIAKVVGCACIVGWVVWLAVSVTGVGDRRMLVGLGLVAVALLVGCFVSALRLPRRPGE